MNSEQKPLAFFNEIYDCYQEAALAKVRDYDYNIAGFPIRLSFAGDALVNRLIPALAHLKTAHICEPLLTICIWDSTSTNTKIPPPSWEGQHLQKRGEIWGLNNDRIHTSFMWGANTLSMLDYERNLGIYWLNNYELLPYWETSSPLRTILQLWLNKKGVQMVHAGAVGIAEGGVLLVGKGGSGKSTTALSCLNSELFYASDDYTLITPNPVPFAYSIYSTGKKKPDDIDRLPFLKPIISNREKLGQEKAVYFLHDHFPEKIINSFPLKAVFIPRVTGKLETNLEKTNFTTGLSALVPSTIKQLPNTGKTACQIMMQIAQKLPCYYLNLGTNIEQIPEVIYQFLKG